jgi:O-antigen ligase
MAGMEIFGWNCFILSLLLISNRIKNNEKLPFLPVNFTIIIMAIVLTWSVSIISSPYDTDKLFRLGRLRNFVFIFVDFYALLFYLDIKKYLDFILAFTILSSVYCLLQNFALFGPPFGDWTFKWTFIGNNNPFGVRGFFNHHLTYSNVFQFYFFIILSCLALNYWKKRTKIIIGIIALVLLAVALVLTTSRSMYIALILSTLGLALLTRKRIYFVTFVSIIAGIIVAYYTTTWVKRKIDDSVIKISQSDFIANQPRQVLWKVNMMMFRQHPLKGVGFEYNEQLSGVYYDRYKIPSGFIGHAHNSFLQVLAGTGLLGFIPYIVFWIFIFYAIIKGYHMACKYGDIFWQVLFNGLFASMVSFIINSWSQWNFGDYEVNHNLMFFVALSLFGYYKLGVKESGKELN